MRARKLSGRVAIRASAYALTYGRWLEVMSELEETLTRWISQFLRDCTPVREGCGQRDWRFDRTPDLIQDKREFTPGAAWLFPVPSHIPRGK